MRFHWFLPTTGDGYAVRNSTIRLDTGDTPAPARQATLAISPRLPAPQRAPVSPRLSPPPVRAALTPGPSAQHSASTPST